MSDFITIQQAISQLFNTVAERHIAGQQNIGPKPDEFIRRFNAAYTSEVFYGNWERGWGASCSLRCRLIKAERRSEPDLALQAEISWSSTGHGVTSALTAITLYREVVELAAHLETQWARWRVAMPEETTEKTS